jgi:hypothetical protein
MAWLSVIEFIIWVTFAGVHLYAAWISSGMVSSEEDPDAVKPFLNCCTGMTYAGIFAYVTKLLARVACVLVPVLMWLACDKTADVNVLALTTVIIAGMNFLSWASVLDWLLGSYTAGTYAKKTESAFYSQTDSIVINTPLRWRDKYI